MKKSIGIRVAPKEISYTILMLKPQSNEITFNVNKLIIPKSLKNDVPRQLSFIRTTLFSIICEYEIEFAGIRTAEGSAQTLDLFRINVEGVIQELFSNSTIKEYFTGTFTSMASRFNSTSTIIKDCSKGSRNIFAINEWEKYSNNQRESILAALSALRISPSMED